MKARGFQSRRECRKINGFTGCGTIRVLTLVLKGRGFSRAVSAAKSMAALAAEAPTSGQDDFFRSLFSRCGAALLVIAPFVIVASVIVSSLRRQSQRACWSAW
ncbi:MAG: hypothetical protein ABR920_02200 [Terriglobales bacterium]